MATSSKTCLVASVDSCHELSIHLKVIRGDGESESRSVLFVPQREGGAALERSEGSSLLSSLQARAFGEEENPLVLVLETLVRILDGRPPDEQIVVYPLLVPGRLSVTNLGSVLGEHLRRPEEAIVRRQGRRPRWLRRQRDEVDPQVARGGAGVVGEVPEREGADLRVVVRQAAISSVAFELVKVGQEDDERFRPGAVVVGLVEEAFLLHGPIELGPVGQDPPPHSAHAAVAVDLWRASRGVLLICEDVCAQDGGTALFRMADEFEDGLVEMVDLALDRYRHDGDPVDGGRRARRVQARERMRRIRRKGSRLDSLARHSW